MPNGDADQAGAARVKAVRAARPAPGPGTPPEADQVTTEAGSPSQSAALARPFEPPNDHLRTGDLDLLKIISVLLWGKWIILVSLLTCLVLAALYLNGKSPKYVATLIVAPTSAGETIGPLASSQNLGLSLLVGNLRPRGAMFAKFKVLMFSRLVAEHLDQKYDVRKKVFKDNWDEATQSWLPPDGIREDIRRLLSRYVPLPEWTPPTADTLAKYIERSIEHELVTDTNLSKFTLRHVDRDFAYDLLSNVYNETDLLMWERERARLQRQSEYLKQRVQATTVVEYRLALGQLIADQEKKMMLMESGLPFVNELVEPVRVGDLPEPVKTVQWLAAAVAVGIIVGMMLVSIAYSVRMRRRRFGSEAPV